MRFLTGNRAPREVRDIAPLGMWGIYFNLGRILGRGGLSSA